MTRPLGTGAKAWERWPLPESNIATQGHAIKGLERFDIAGIPPNVPLKPKVPLLFTQQHLPEQSPPPSIFPGVANVVPYVVLGLGAMKFLTPPLLVFCRAGTRCSIRRSGGWNAEGLTPPYPGRSEAVSEHSA